MGEFWKKGWIGKLITSVKGASRLNIPLYAANAGYFIILSLFPTLILLMDLLRRTGMPLQTLLEQLDRVIPRALMERGQGLIISIYETAGGAVIGLSAVTALWSASRGIHGLRVGLNAIYGMEEKRGYFCSRGISLVYTLAFLAVLLLTLVLLVFGNSILVWMEQMNIPVIALLAGIIDFRFFLLLVILTVFFGLMYMAVPSGQKRFRDGLPGALLAALGWLVFSDLFSVYVARFTGNANLYGSVYALALSMLWLYGCLGIVFWGGALNRYFLREKPDKN